MRFKEPEKKGPKCKLVLSSFFFLGLLHNNIIYSKQINEYWPCISYCHQKNNNVMETKFGQPNCTQQLID